MAGIACTVRVSGIDEVPSPHESPGEYVLRLAEEKCAAVPHTADEFVLAADTTVVIGEELLEKPHSSEDAARMLRRLSGNEHHVLTGVCIRHGGKAWSGVEQTKVRFSALSESEILDYSQSGEPMDKAGGYAIQGLASKFVESVEGCYFNIVGLPVSRVYRMLKDAGYNFALG